MGVVVVDRLVAHEGSPQSVRLQILHASEAENSLSLPRHSVKTFLDHNATIPF